MPPNHTGAHKCWCQLTYALPPPLTVYQHAIASMKPVRDQSRCIASPSAKRFVFCISISAKSRPTRAGSACAHTHDAPQCTGAQSISWVGNESNLGPPATSGANSKLAASLNAGWKLGCSIGHSTLALCSGCEYARMSGVGLLDQPAWRPAIDSTASLSHTS